MYFFFTTHLSLTNHLTSCLCLVAPPFLWPHLVSVNRHPTYTCKPQTSQSIHVTLSTVGPRGPGPPTWLTESTGSFFRITFHRSGFSVPRGKFGKITIATHLNLLLILSQLDKLSWIGPGKIKIKIKKWKWRNQRRIPLLAPADCDGCHVCRMNNALNS